MKSNPTNSASSSTGPTQSSSLSAPQPASPKSSPAGINYRAHNGYDVKAASDETGLVNNEPSLTVQAHAEDADINVLMRRYGITGKMPENPDQLAAAMWGDFTENPINDYRSAVEAVRAAHEGFMLFPAEIRARYDNDPGRFIEWVNNPENAEEARKFGLVKPLVTEPPLSRDTQAIVEALKKAEPPKSGGPST